MENYFREFRVCWNWKGKLKSWGHSLLRRQKQAEARKQMSTTDTDEFLVLTEEVTKLQTKLRQRNLYTLEIKDLNDRCRALNERCSVLAHNEKVQTRMALDAEAHAKILADELYNAERDRDVTLQRMQELEEALDYEPNSAALSQAYAERNAALEELEVQRRVYDNAKFYHAEALARQRDLEEKAQWLASQRSDAERAASEYRTLYQQTLEDARGFEKGMVKAQKQLEVLDMCTSIDREIKTLSEKLRPKGMKLVQLYRADAFFMWTDAKPNPTMSERREWIAQDYQMRLWAQNDRHSICRSPRIKSQVHELLREWIQDRNDICHQPGFIQTVDYDSFYMKTQRVQTFLHEHSMDIEGILSGQFSVVY